MKMLLVILLLQHAVISARGGLVTYVRNMTQLVDTHMGEGNPIQSNRGSRFEAMLGPDTYVRIRDDTEIVLESEALDHVVLRVVEGTAIVSARNLDEDIPIRILMTDLEFTIGNDGVYLFEPDRITVLDGEMRVTDANGNFNDTRLRKDWTLVRQGAEETFAEARLEDADRIEALPLVRWDRQRTAQLTPEPIFRRVRPTRRFRF